MATISKPNTFSAGATIIASEHNENFDTIYNDYNGNITNANISASANIADTKLANITAAGKVNGTALTNLPGVPSGAGLLPNANWLNSGTSLPSSPSAQDTFYHTTWNKLLIYNGTAWDVMNLASDWATSVGGTFANSTGDIVSLSFTPYTTDIIIMAFASGGFNATGASPDIRVRLRRDGSTTVGTTNDQELSGAPIHTSPIVIAKDTGLTRGTSYTYALENVATGSTCVYDGATIIIKETNA